MNYPQAIVAAAGILAGALIVTNIVQTAPDQNMGQENPRYLIAATPGQSVANAWRIDTQTGEIYRCFATGGVHGAVCRVARFFDVEESSDQEDPNGLDPDSTKFSPKRQLTKWGRLLNH
jgi:hypothetical protein